MPLNGAGLLVHLPKRCSRRDVASGYGQLADLGHASFRSASETDLGYDLSRHESIARAWRKSGPDRVGGPETVVGPNQRWGPEQRARSRWNL